MRFAIAPAGYPDCRYEAEDERRRHHRLNYFGFMQ